MKTESRLVQTLILYSLAVISSFLLPVTLVLGNEIGVSTPTAIQSAQAALVKPKVADSNAQQKALDYNSELDLKLCAETIIKAYRFIRVGKAQVWLTDCSVSEEEFFKIDKRLLFFYEKDVPARAFKEASIYYLEKNLSGDYLAEVRDPIDSFNSNYRSMEPGDVYTLSHSTVTGLSLFKNSEYLGTMSNLNAARDYFVIWFGKKPFNGPMKKDLLEQLREPGL